MRNRWAVFALVAGLVTSCLAFATPWMPLAYALLIATVVLVPGAVFLELAARRDTRRAVLVTALFVAGILLFADSQLIGGIGYIATIVLLLAIGIAEGHLRAVGWAIVFLASAFAADVLWMLRVPALRPRRRLRTAPAVAVHPHQPADPDGADRTRRRDSVDLAAALRSWSEDSAPRVHERGMRPARSRSHCWSPASWTSATSAPSPGSAGPGHSRCSSRSGSPTVASAPSFDPDDPHRDRNRRPKARQPNLKGPGPFRFHPANLPPAGRVSQGDHHPPPGRGAACPVSRTRGASGAGRSSASPPRRSSRPHRSPSRRSTARPTARRAELSSRT